nr:aspartyl/asparaginyl beta-hydroxylase domain-containing protein [Pseudenhygromyxa sp. WMMC2535]
MRLPGLRSQPLWDDQRERFPAVAGLEANFAAVRAEYHALRDTLGLRRYSDGSLVDQGTWGQLHLRVQSRRIEEHAAACPTVSALLLDDGARVGVTYFSAHAPGTRVRPHYGPGNYRIRCHLGIEVPERCGMRVGEVEFRWREGRCTLLDDSFFHDVWNDGPGARAILLTDFWHPDLLPEEIRVFEGMMREPSERAHELRRVLSTTGEELLPPSLWRP